MKMRMNFIEQKKLVLLLVAVVLVIATPLLCLTLLMPATAGDVGVKEVKVESEIAESNTAERNLQYMTQLEIRNPEIAKSAGIRGYVDLEWKGNVGRPYVNRGEHWTGILLATFVSYSPELDEVTVTFDPNSERGGKAAREYLLKDGSHVWVDYSSLISYRPEGSIVIKAGETKEIEVTFSIPDDLPHLVFTKDFPEDLRAKAENTLRLTPVGVYTDALGVAVLGDKLAQELVIQ